MTIGHLPFGTQGFDKNKNDVKQKNSNSGFLQQVRNDFKEIDNLPVSQLNSLDDLRNSTGKSFRTSDIENLMEKYDPEAFVEYKKIAYTPEGGHSSSGLSYLSRWMDEVKTNPSKAGGAAKPNDISSGNEDKLSKKAQDFLNSLREQYGEFDFMIGNGTDDLQALSKMGNKEFSVIFSSAEIERMANDEKYANERMQGVFGAVRMAYQIEEEYGTDGTDGQNGLDNVEKLGVIIDDDGNMKYFAELEKNSAKQKERIEKSREERANERKEAERERRKNPYGKTEEPSVKRTRVEADTMEELLEKIAGVDWDSIADSRSGDRFSYSV